MPLRLLIGIIYGVTVAAVVSFFAAVFGGMWAGGLFIAQDFMNFFSIIVVSFSVGFAVVANSAKSAIYDSKKAWLISAIFAFSTVALSGSIFSMIQHAIVFGGFDRVNIPLFFVSGPLYALVLLPITTPISFTCNLFLVDFVRKY